MIILYNNSDSDSADLFYHGIFLDDKSPNRTVTHWFVTFPLVCSSADGALLAFWKSTKVHSNKTPLILVAGLSLKLDTSFG